MRRWSLSVTGLLCLVAMLSAVSAMAQNATVSTNPPAYGQGSNSLSQTPSGGLRVQLQSGGQDTIALPTIPPKFTCSGTLAGAGASALLSTVTPSSGCTYPTTAFPSNYVGILNIVSSTGTADVCLNGGTCASTGGRVVAQGEEITRNPNPATVTVFAPSGVNLYVEW